MKKRIVIALPVLLAAFLLGADSVQPTEADSGSGWIELFDGETLDGWHRVTEGHHGNTEGWSVEDGAIVGRQDKPGNGGVLISDKTFGDFVIELEINPDWGLDSGLFFRADEHGSCYQMMIDYYEGGDVGGIYGEAIGGFLFHMEDWAAHYNKGEWNKVMAVVTGNPPRIDTWINGYHYAEYEGGGEVKLPAEGHIGLQVHTGEKYYDLKTRYRDIRIRELP